MCKKMIAAFILACASFSSMGQTVFRIKGNLADTSRDGEKVVLNYFNGDKRVVTSAVIQAGVFVLEGIVKSPARAKLTLGPSKEMVKTNLWVSPEECEFFIEGGEITLNGYPFKKADIKVPGQSEQDFLKLQAVVQPFKEKADASYISMLHAIVDRNPEARKRDSLLNAGYKKQVDSVEVAFLQGYPASYVSLDLLKDRINPTSLSLKLHTVTDWYNHLSQPVRQSVAGKQLAETIATATRLAPGKQAENFVLNDTLGNPVQLSAFKGKYVLLDFWASWCIPCRAENPGIARAYERFKDRNFTVLSVSLEKPGDRSAWVAAIVKDKLTWTQVAPLKQEERDAITRLYGIQSIPMNFLIDPQGKIVANYLRGDQLMKKLEETL